MLLWRGVHLSLLQILSIWLLFSFHFPNLVPIVKSVQYWLTFLRTCSYHFSNYLPLSFTFSSYSLFIFWYLILLSWYYCWLSSSFFLYFFVHSLNYFFTISFFPNHPWFPYAISLWSFINYLLIICYLLTWIIFFYRHCYLSFNTLCVLS